MAAKLDKLHALHEALTAAMLTRLEQDAQDSVFTDAATLGAVSKFLKDNEITADPADREDLSSLRQQLTAQREARKASRVQVLSLVETDVIAKEA